MPSLPWCPERGAGTAVFFPVLPLPPDKDSRAGMCRPLVPPPPQLIPKEGMEILLEALTGQVKLVPELNPYSAAFVIGPNITACHPCLLPNPCSLRGCKDCCSSQSLGKNSCWWFEVLDTGSSTPVVFFPSKMAAPQPLLHILHLGFIESQ